MRRDLKFTLGPTTLPTGDPVTRLLRSDIVSVERLTPAGLNGATPPSETQVDYRKNWTVQREGLAGTVLADPDRKEWLGKEYRTVFAPAAAGVLSKYPRAVPFRFATLLHQTAHAQALATQVQAVLDTEPEMLRVVALDNARSNAIDLADVFELDYPQYGWDEKSWRCLRLRPNQPNRGLVTAECFG